MYSSDSVKRGAAGGGCCQGARDTVRGPSIAHSRYWAGAEAQAGAPLSSQSAVLQTQRDCYLRVNPRSGMGPEFGPGIYIFFFEAHILDTFFPQAPIPSHFFPLRPTLLVR